MGGLTELTGDLFKAGAYKGVHNPKMICPHCQTEGKVYSCSGVQKGGISGGKAIGGWLTGGLSLLATGIQQRHDVTLARCDNCKSQWQF